MLVNIGLFTINALTEGTWWFSWPLMGWGVGLGIHALVVFVFGGGGPWRRDWEERKTRGMMGKERGCEDPESGAHKAPLLRVPGGFRATIGAVGLGALAVGATAVGALSMGALAIRALAVKRSRIERLDIEELRNEEDNRAKESLLSRHETGGGT